MQHGMCLVAILLLVSVVVAQQPQRQQQPPAPNSRNYVPVVPSPSINSYGGGGGGYYGGVSGAGTTAAGSAMSGMASVISASGDNKLATSAAAVNWTQAQSNEIQNRQQYANTYFEMQHTADAERKAAIGPPPSMEQLVRIAHAGVPKGLSHSQLDPLSGKINWPLLLQDARYAPERADVDSLVKKQATYGALGLSDNTAARQTVETMSGKLKAQIRDVPAPLYTESKSFLQSLIYYMTKTPLG